MTTELVGAGASLPGISKQELLGLLKDHTRSPQDSRKPRACIILEGLEKTEQYAIHLVEIVVDPHAALLEVQAEASELFKDYIKTNWYSAAQEDLPPKMTLESKKKIVGLLSVGLQEFSLKAKETGLSQFYRKMQHITSLVSTIARQDWTGLFDILVNRLSTENDVNAISGAMRLLPGCVENVDAERWPNLRQDILHELYRIFENENCGYSLQSRVAAIELFAKIIGLIPSPNSDLILKLLEPEISKFFERFVETMDRPDELLCDRGALETAIISAISSLILKAPKSVFEVLPKMLPLLWKILKYNASIHQDAIFENDDIDFLISTIKCINVLLNKYMLRPDSEYNLKNCNWFIENESLSPEALFPYLILFVEFTDEECKEFNDDPFSHFMRTNSVVFSHESDANDSVRRVAEFLLVDVVSSPKRPGAIEVLCDVFNKRIEAGNALRISLDAEVSQNWWKSHEASINALGFVAHVISKKRITGSSRFDILNFFEKVVLPDLNNPGSHPLLQGRCLQLGAIYAHLIPREMLSLFLNATKNGLGKDSDPCTKIYAAEAVDLYFSAASNAQNGDMKELLGPHLPVLFEGLFNLGSQVMTVEVHSLILKSIFTLTQIDKTFTASVNTMICSLTITAYFNFDCNIRYDFVHDIFAELSRNPDCIGQLQTQLVPRLIGMMTINSAYDPLKQDLVLKALEILVVHSPQPLSSLLIESAFPAACRYILNCDHHWKSVFASAIYVILMYVSVAAQQLIELRDISGTTGVQYILQVVVRFLNQIHTVSARDRIDEICKIVTLLIEHADGNLGDNIDSQLQQLLEALLSAVERTEESHDKQYFFIVLARLINTQFNVVFNFLAAAPGAGSHQSALAFVILEGFCKRDDYSLSDDENNLMMLALHKILGHGLKHRDSQLHKITFTETKEDSKTTVPILVKISQLITEFVS